MATLTTNISSVSLTVSGNTTQSTTISWTCPTVPSGATISSCTLTGTATASMSKGSATITVNGTTVSSGSPFTINLGTSNTTSSVTATAKGGNKNASGTVTFSNLVYTVNYTEPVVTYTVTFKDWDGTVLKTQTVNSGSSATAPSTPTRTGYTFTGWDKSYTNVTSNLTVTAQYTINTYTVTFIDYDGTTLKTQTVEHGKSATAPTNPSRVGYTFVGWSPSTFSNITSNLTVTAQYAIITYIVKFVDYDGTVLATQTIEYGQSATAPSNLNRTGYEFIGWSTDFTNVTSDITVTAQYKKITTLTIKENGSWNTVSKVFKRVSGQWIEQNNDNWENLFNINRVYIRNYLPIPTAILYSDGELVFCPNEKIDILKGDIIDKFTGWEKDVYLSRTDVPWYNYRGRIKKVKTNGIKALSVSYWFSALPLLNSLDLSNFDTSNVTNMNNMADSAMSLTSLDLSNFDTSNVTNMEKMFYNCPLLTSLNLASFDTSSVTNMSDMFSGCSALTPLNLSSFDTSSVTNMSYMFNNCSSLTSLDLSSFDMSNVVSTDYMFQNCTNPNLTIYVKDAATKTKIESSTKFPSTATVVIGKPN